MTQVPPNHTGNGHTWKSRSAWIILLVTVALALVADLASKSMAFASVAGDPVTISRAEVLNPERDPRLINELIPPHPPMTVVPRLLEFTLVLNPGAVFGIGPGQRFFFIGFTGVALAFGLWIFSTWTTPRDRLAHAAIGLVLAGGIGNLYDRTVFGCVRDFIHPLPGLLWPGGWKPLGGNGEVWPYVSNVADLELLIGIGVLLVFLWRRDSAKAAKASEASDAPATDSAVAPAEPPTT